MNFCHQYPGGAEVELTMLFVDARGSTSLAETMSAAAFGKLLNRFYAVATDVLIRTDAFVDKFVGDEVIGLYMPLFTGPNHARPAVQAAQELLRVTGHGDAKGPWLPIGVGVHTGVAWVGTVKGTEDSISDVTALGDNVNITARLASKAGAGEALISDATYAAAGLNFGELEQRQLELKGKSEPVGVRVVRVGSGMAEAK
jgi:adenylate cyclase